MQSVTPASGDVPPHTSDKPVEQGRGTWVVGQGLSGSSRDAGEQWDVGQGSSSSRGAREQWKLPLSAEPLVVMSSALGAYRKC